ncbi:SulP family inorganic anion transporter [Pseudomarimonas arenosa]|uniref:STAS domain-containing protein n=1 Tax=Pseudomarimonas arenosa TaxID=2774145 RepID=A0AAW3ZKU1_9GAMM|nr:SulP family inorganic anion transporter [Pseudomarimonas arenosa]MBD8525804.1 STAS domain-containing protein [Pseudomarimonas arenosa]
MSSNPPVWHLFVPKLFTTLRRGYSVDSLKTDALAGLTVAVVALPLAMALAIASGTTPEKGLHTAIIAGFLISALGGSRVQIGGPTAAFIPVVFVVIQQHGYGGLILCTLLAGLMLIAAGLLRLGTLMKYMPQPVITGFTAGIAVSIFMSQVKDALGLPITQLPGEFIQRVEVYAEHLPSLNVWAAITCGACLLLIVLLRRWRPHWPGLLIAVVAGALACSLFDMPLATIGSQFGSIPSALPSFEFPHIPFDRTAELLPASLTIAFLAGVESLLSAVVADGMTGGKHRSNAELVAQGVANCGSALFGGLPATGAIARTATNIRSGARTPMAGVLHALFLLLFMLLLAPLMRYVPLAALAAVLLMVAWNMSEIHRFRQLLKSPKGDAAVLLVTFALTVAVDLTVAIEVGVVMAAFLFMHRMSGVVSMESEHRWVEQDVDDLSRAPSDNQQARLPPGVAAFRISGPLFFAVANRLDDVLNQYPDTPRVFILRMRQVPLVDASGATAIGQFLDRCQRSSIKVILSGAAPQPIAVLGSMHINQHPALLGFADDFEHALALADQAGRPDAGFE